MRKAVRREKIDIGNKRKFSLLILIFIVSLSVVGYHIYIRLRDNKVNNDVRNEIIKIYEEPKIISEEPKESSKIEKLEELQKTNSDIIALIEIEGTNINYPVLHCDNNDYYMTHNYKKEYSNEVNPPY